MYYTSYILQPQTIITDLSKRYICNKIAVKDQTQKPVPITSISPDYGQSFLLIDTVYNDCQTTTFGLQVKQSTKLILRLPCDMLTTLDNLCLKLREKVHNEKQFLYWLDLPFCRFWYGTEHIFIYLQFIKQNCLWIRLHTIK